jgi:hypothetical protein
LAGSAVVLNRWHAAISRYPTGNETLLGTFACGIRYRGGGIIREGMIPMSGRETDRPIKKPHSCDIARRGHHSRKVELPIREQFTTVTYRESSPMSSVFHWLKRMNPSRQPRARGTGRNPDSRKAALAGSQPRRRSGCLIIRAWLVGVITVHPSARRAGGQAECGSCTDRMILSFSRSRHAAREPPSNASTGGPKLTLGSEGATRRSAPARSGARINRERGPAGE